MLNIGLTIHGYSKKNEFEYWVSTQNSSKMSYSTQTQTQNWLKMSSSIQNSPKKYKKWKLSKKIRFI